MAHRNIFFLLATFLLAEISAVKMTDEDPIKACFTPYAQAVLKAATATDYVQKQKILCPAIKGIRDCIDKIPNGDPAWKETAERLYDEVKGECAPYWLQNEEGFVSSVLSTLKSKDAATDCVKALYNATQKAAQQSDDIQRLKILCPAVKTFVSCIDSIANISQDIKKAAEIIYDQLNKTCNPYWLEDHPSPAIVHLLSLHQMEGKCSEELLKAFQKSGPITNPYMRLRIMCPAVKSYKECICSSPNESEATKAFAHALYAHYQDACAPYWNDQNEVAIFFRTFLRNRKLSDDEDNCWNQLVNAAEKASHESDDTQKNKIICPAVKAFKNCIDSIPNVDPKAKEAAQKLYDLVQKVCAPYWLQHFVLGRI